MFDKKNIYVQVKYIYSCQIVIVQR